ncbi:long-chain-alcohol o-fatty-acyltransferase [Quercus suber]|uniref:Long-chain-alcohol o-fatty-acyltransferase n=1 Tax=Quercus suber TaxID=58331 RepID=A0AAW0L052_QUESU
MDSEIKNLIEVWFTVVTSLCYCYYIVARIPRGMIRLLFLLPIFYLFTMLPCNINSINLGGPAAFFLGWLGNFKLLLFAFDQGPLSPPPQKLLHFISIACLPIKLKQGPPLNTKNNKNPSHKNIPKSQNPTKVPTSILLVIKALFLAMIIHAYDNRPILYPYVILTLYCCHIHLAVEIVLALVAALVQAIFGFEIEPQFNEPYLATSLQDFWGHRPISCVHSTWEVTWFFVLHGICTVIEVVVKKAMINKWQLHRAISGPLTIGFVVVTSGWLFFLQLIRNGVDIKVTKEYSILIDFVKVNLPLQLPLDKS